MRPGRVRPRKSWSVERRRATSPACFNEAGAGPPPEIQTLRLEEIEALVLQ